MNTSAGRDAAVAVTFPWGAKFSKADARSVGANTVWQ